MKIIYSPCAARYKINYEFIGEKVTAEINGQSDSVDFSDMPPGKCWGSDIETSLPVTPFLAAQRFEDGVLEVTLVNTYEDSISQEEGETDDDFARRVSDRDLQKNLIEVDV